MLVLTRKVNEGILIGDFVEVVVIDIKGDQVRLGVAAPRSLPVHRREVYEEIERENLRAANPPLQGSFSGLSDFFSPQESLEGDSNEEAPQVIDDMDW